MAEYHRITGKADRYVCRRQVGKIKREDGAVRLKQDSRHSNSNVDRWWGNVRRGYATTAVEAKILCFEKRRGINIARIFARTSACSPGSAVKANRTGRTIAREWVDDKRQGEKVAIIYVRSPQTGDRTFSIRTDQQPADPKATTTTCE